MPEFTARNGALRIGTHLALLAASLPAVLAGPALAQVVEPENEVEQVVVTGERAASDYTADAAVSFGFAPLAIKEIPQSIQVITRDLIVDQGALSLAELLNNNVAGASNSIGRSVPFGTASTRIRGQDVSIYRDGLRDVDFSDIDSSAMANVASIEILKGTAGLIFGTGGPGGIVNIITKRPTETFAAEVTATIGERETKILSADVSAPLGRGFGIRAVAEIERSDSFIDFSEIERDNVAFVLGYDEGGPLTARARYERHSNRDDHAMTRVGLPSVGTIQRTDIVDIDRSTYLGEPSFDFTDSYGDQTSVFLAYAVNDTLTLEAAGRRTTVNFEQADVRTLGVLSPTTLLLPRTRARMLDLESEQHNARVLARLTVPAGRFSHDISVGYEFFRFDLGFVNRNVPNAAVPRINVVNPSYLLGGLQATLGAPVPFDQLSDSHELFAQDVVRFGDLTVTGAIRRIASEFDGAEELDNTVYQLGAAYAVTSRLSVFAGVNSGFDANADIAADRNRDGQRFEPEEYRQVEAGIKTDVLANVTGSLSIFRLTRENILVADPLDAAFLIQAAEERSQGFEADAVWTPSPAFVLRGGYAYLDAEIVDDTNPTRIGRKRPNAPRHQANAYGAYTIQDGPLRNLRLGAGVSYFGESKASISNAVVQPSRTIANLSASYSFSRYRLDATLTNAFDEEYFFARNDAQVNAGEPRLFTLRASARY